MLQPNDIVRVKPGIEDPDFGGDIGGWQGRVTEIDTTNPEDVLVMIEWDANTLNCMSRAYLKACFADGFDHEHMKLGVSELELVQNPKEDGDRRAVLDALEKEYSWEDLGEQGLRIKAVEDACIDDFALMDHWFEYLETHIQLPLNAKYIGDSSRNLSYGAILQINGFTEADEDYGVIGSARFNKRWVEVPLCDIEVLEPSSQTQALEDYIVWFVNR